MADWSTPKQLRNCQSRQNAREVGQFFSRFSPSLLHSGIAGEGFLRAWHHRRTHANRVDTWIHMARFTNSGQSSLPRISADETYEGTAKNGTWHFPKITYYNTSGSEFSHIPCIGRIVLRIVPWWARNHSVVTSDFAYHRLSRFDRPALGKSDSVCHGYGTCGVRQDPFPFLRATTVSQ